MSAGWWAAVALVAAIGLPAIGLRWTSLAGPINTAVTTATFVAVFWYAIETRRLVAGQERTAEIDRHPWLEATNLKPEEIPPTEGFGGYHIWLPIKNVGQTPAVDLEIDAMTTVSDPTLDRAVEARERRVGQTLVPSDVLHQEIARALLEGPHTTIEVQVRITYRTIDAGRGRLAVGFRYTAQQGWRNLPTRYETWLRDGTHFV